MKAPDIRERKNNFTNPTCARSSSTPRNRLYNCSRVVTFAVMYLVAVNDWKESTTYCSTIRGSFLALKSLNLFRSLPFLVYTVSRFTLFPVIGLNALFRGWSKSTSSYIPPLDFMNALKDLLKRPVFVKTENRFFLDVPVSVS